MLQAQPLDVNAVVVQLTRMLDRLLPATISVRLTPAPSVGLVKADRGQLEQVILNLVINARDAMPRAAGSSAPVNSVGSARTSEPIPTPADVPIRRDATCTWP